MKITPAKVKGFLAKPDTAVLAILIFGPDRGLVRERAKALGKTVLDDLNDPFRVVELTATALKADPARLADEAQAMSFTGGRRLIMISDAADSLTATFKSFLEHPVGDALIVIEGGELTTRSSLRKLFEGEKTCAAAIACYGDEGRGLQEVIRETLATHNLRPSPDAMGFLIENLGSDRMVTRGELEKLALYKGGEGTIELEDCLAAIGDNGTTTFDDIIYSAANGNSSGLDKALLRTFDEGQSPIAIIRAATRHFQRLHLAAGQMQKGMNADQAMKTLRPPVIFKVADAFRAQLRRWTPDKIGRAMDILMQAEMDCKTTGMPAEAICSRALLRISTAARH